MKTSKMKTSKSILILTFVSITFLSCIFDNSKIDEEIWPVSTGVIQNIELNNEKISFDVIVGVTSSGWKLANPKIDFDAPDYHIQFMGIRPTGPSFPAMSSLETSITLDVVPGNTYTFKFWRHNEAPLDTTIAIPN